jgi:tryptophan synthase alpha chain
MELIRQQQGLAALHTMFETTAAQKRTAFLPYWSVGYPDFDASLDALQRLAALGVDGFEIGIPFSDPLADGVVIQATTQKALENGITVKKCLEAVQILRGKDVQQPMMMMSYLNPLVAYGTERFVQDAKAAGADGLIVPDLPPEEAHYFADACRRENMALVFFLAPTSSEARIKMTASHATGFIYAVAQVGITGARDTLSNELPGFLARVRQYTKTPLVVGFGISKPEHVQALHHKANGFIVASALLREYGNQGADAMQALAQSLNDAANHAGV